MRRSAALAALVVGAVALAAALGAGTAHARPLKLSEIYDLGKYLACTEACPALPDAATYDDAVAHEQCLVDCGHAPRIWEKNGIPPVDRADHQLALLEYDQSQDPTRAIICYGDAEQTIVVPAALCTGGVCEAAPECTDADCAAPTDPTLQCVDDRPGGPRCIWPDSKRPAHCPDVVCDARPTHSFQQCADGDGDGVPAWLEEHLGLDDGTRESRCGASSVCAFDETCRYDPDLGAGLCAPRDCGDCTAFHLELVAQDDTEAVVHVHYDYTALPARALDLYLDYDHAALTLEDARPLRPLSLEGKQLATTERSDGTLRLSVFDVAGSHPIPTGPIIELVFLRTSPDATTIAFSSDDLLQAASVAPLQGDAAGQSQLTDDARWGAPVELGPTAEAPATLLLWYGFDSLDAPATWLDVPDADALCAKYPACANEPDAAEKAKMLARLTALQAGTLVARDQVDGITHSAVYLDGSSDHLRLPVTFEEPLAPAAQSFSFATWFYSEGNSLDEIKQTPQIIFSHNGPNERSRFGLRLESDGDGALNLVFFDGDVLSQSPPPAVKVLAQSLGLRTWHHVGFALDADLGKVDLYFDGQRTGDYTFPRKPAVVCPQLSAGIDVLQHVEGDVLGGAAPEAVYYAAERSNLYAVEKMDIGGLGARTILGDGQFSYRDPDYQPSLDRLVFSSNASGSFEIWMAHGDGSEAQQLTVGFGDAARGIAARRPRWAPDGSGIVFDSNVYDVLAQDNTFKRVSHIYYMGYDAANQQVAIELPDGTTAEQLDYQALLAQNSVSSFRLTKGAQARNHRNARWLRGKSGVDDAKGELLIDTSGPTFEQQSIARLHIPAILDLATVEPILGLGEPWHEVQMIAAHHSETAALVPITKELLFYQRDFAEYPPEPDFPLTPITYDTQGATVHVTYKAPAFDPATCWDLNHNHLHDTTEDRNGDNAWDAKDCLPYEVRNLYVEYDADWFAPVLEDAAGHYVTPGPVVLSLNKSLKLKAVEPLGHSYVRVEVMSPLSAAPLVNGEIASLRFLRLRPGTPLVPFGTFRREAESELLVKDLTSVAPPTPFKTAGVFEQVEDGAFAPRGGSLLLEAISHSRPILVRTDDLLGAEGAESLIVEPTRLSGIDWVREQSFYPCNWAGGTLHLQSKQIVSGLRGGLDDLKLWSGLRDPDAFRSEAERGHELLARDGRDGELDSRLPSCGNSHAECPPYHLCVHSECVTVPCDPNDPYACSDEQARCTLRPLPVEQENTGLDGDPAAFDWVCSADCNTDSQCFSQACLNGPCRFCDAAEHSCSECQDVVRDLGSLTYATTEGCPDTKSFACVEGACLTDCYAFEDGKSIYLCDPALEYCDKGKCVMHDWTWWDFAPATFEGTGDMALDVAPDPVNGWPGETQVVDQRVPIEVHAYGVADYGQSPELVVEARGGPFYGADWARIARVVVYNRTSVEAAANPYVVTSPHPFNDLRMRLITAPYNNLTGAAGGLGQHDDQFCLADFAATAAAAGTPNAAPDACYYEAQGSQYTLGYPADISPRESIEFCQQHGHDDCPPSSQGELDFVSGGNPAVVVLDVQVDGGGAMNNITSDTVCSYEGGMIPVDGGVAKKLYYGDIQKEMSNERDAYCAANPSACAGHTGLVEFDRATYGYALLNCNVVDPTAKSAAITFQNIIIVRDFPMQSGLVLETANNCTVDVDAFRVEPCYTFIGGGSSVDPNNAIASAGSTEVFASFEFGSFANFAHDEGFTSVELGSGRLTAHVIGYRGGGLRLGRKDTHGSLVEAVDVPDPASPGAVVDVVFPTDILVGRRSTVTIERPSSLANHVCVVDPTAAGIAMGYSFAATVNVVCTTAQPVNVVVTGLHGSLALTDNYATAAGQVTSAVDALVVTGNGATPFAQALPTGANYHVAIAGQPAGQVCAIGAGSTGIVTTSPATVIIACRDVAMSALEVSLSGLAGSGLELVERATGRTVTAHSGDSVATFPGLFEEGRAFEIAIAAQPAAPAQLCALATGDIVSGTMPTGDLVAAAVTCTTLPTYTLSGQVLGLTGYGLTIANGADTLSLAPPATTGAPVPFAFPTGLLDAADYSVTVQSQPTTPDQSCDVLFGAGAVAASDVGNVMVVCHPKPAGGDPRRIGGTVNGLTGSGLRLSMNGVERLSVTRGGAFTFANPLQTDAAYQVAIDRQPSNPTQVCTLAHGQGTVGLGDVSDIAVTCRDAMKVTVQVHSPSANGAQVKALLVSTGTGAALVGESPAGVVITDGDAVFMMRVPHASDDAAVAPGSYRLYVFVNDDMDFEGSTGLPHYEPVKDRGAVVLVTGTAQSPPSVTIGDDDLTPLAFGDVTVRGDGLDPYASVQCFFAASGAGPLTLPPGPGAALVATSARACDPAGDPCTTTDGGAVVLATDSFGPLSDTAAYDVTCWVDVDHDDNLTPGDLVGSAMNMAIGEPITVDLTPETL